MAKAVQYRGRIQILKAFDNAGIVAWSFSNVNSKQVIGKYAGGNLEDSKEALERLLKELEKSNTSSEYTLSFYEDVKDRRKIRSSLEPDISCNVLLFDNEDNPSPAYERARNNSQLIMDRLDVIEAKLSTAAAEEEDDDEEEEKIAGPGARFMGFLDKILDNPQVQEGLGQKIIGFIENFFSPPQNIPMEQPAPAAMGSPGELPQVTQDQADKIQQAITILVGVDDMLGDHLLEIARIAQANPKKYHKLINMIDML